MTWPLWIGYSVILYARLGTRELVTEVAEVYLICSSTYEPHHEKTCLMPCAKNQRCRSACASAQSDHYLRYCSLLRKYSTCKAFAMYEIARLQVASVAEQAGLSLTWPHTSEGRFSCDEAHVVYCSSSLCGIRSLIGATSGVSRTLFLSD